ncbi:MAG: DUF3107 family protein [Acidimicrobiia bacterium]|nr:DUF3107 family protein [Acidimicrobiia bacterium]
MKARIGIADTDRIVDLEVDDPEAFETSVGAAFSGDEAMIWFEDTKGRRVGIPRGRIAFVEVEKRQDRASVGFAAGG